MKLVDGGKVKPKLSAIVILWILALLIVPLRLCQLRDRDKGPGATPAPASPKLSRTSGNNRVDPQAKAFAAPTLTGVPHTAGAEHLVHIQSRNPSN